MLKKFFESIVYAGLKPGADPLYLSKRTLGQKVGRVLLLVAMMMVVISGGLAAVYTLRPKTSHAPRQLTAAELSAKTLPEFNKEIKLESNQDLDVTEVHFEHAPGDLIAGSIRNKSDHQIHRAVILFALANRSNSELGGVTVTEMDLPAGATRSFKQSIEQTNAMYALVREVQTK